MKALDITSEETGKSYIIRFPPSLDLNSKNKIDALMPTWLLSTSILFILDFSQLISLSNAAYPSFVHFSRKLKENKKFLYTIGVNRKLLLQLRFDGLENAFSPVSSIEEAYKLAGLKSDKKVTLDSNLVNPFIDAAVNTLQIQAQMKDVKTGKPFLKKPNSPNENIAIAAVISLICSDFNGSISIEFPKNVFLNIYEHMLGEKFNEISDEIKDGAAELLNMIYGQAKTTLNNNGFNLDRAIPTVMVGEKLKIHHSLGSIALVVPIVTADGNFYIEIALGQN